MSQNIYEINKSPRIQNLVDQLFEKLPEIESDRAVLLTESYKESEGQPIIVRRAKAFSHILRNIPITIRKDELIVGSATKSPRSCQVFPEFSYDWLEKEQAGQWPYSDKTSYILTHQLPSKFLFIINN